MSTERFSTAPNQGHPCKLPCEQKGHDSLDRYGFAVRSTKYWRFNRLCIFIGSLQAGGRMSIFTKLGPVPVSTRFATISMVID